MSYRGNKDDPDPDELELLSFEEESSKDVILFLIDAGPTMHDTLVPASPNNPLISVSEDVKDSKVSLLHRALEGAVALMRAKLVGSPRDQVGVLLYNTEKTEMPSIGKTSTFRHTHIVQPPGLINIMSLAELIDDLEMSRDDPSYLRQRFEPKETEMRLQHAFDNAVALLKQTGKTGSKRIFFVTHTDDPYATSVNKAGVRRHLENKVRDLATRGIEFVPFLVSTDEKPFDVAKFWGPIFAAALEDGFVTASAMSRSQTPADPGQGVRPLRLEQLEDHVAQSHTPKRVNFRGPMKFGEGCTIGVRGYSMIHRATKGTPIKVIEDKDSADAADGGPMTTLEIDSRVELFCKDTGTLLQPKDIESAFSFGDDAALRSKVKFTPLEIARLKSFGQKPGIEVLGFKPDNEYSLRWRDNYKNAYFLYPFDEVWKNSKRFFTALLNSMLRKKVIGLGIFMRVQGNQPMFCALLPQAEEPARKIPAGIHLIPLPYADDVRDPPEKHNDALEANEEQVEAAKALVKAYSKAGEFKPEDFPNPALAHHYEVLISTALGKPLPGDQDVVDHTIPNYANIAKRAGARIRELGELCTEDDRIAHATAVAGGFSSRDAEDLMDKYRKQELGKLKVDDLKAALEYYRQPKSGKKAELIERLENFLDKLDAKTASK